LTDRTSVVNSTVGRILRLNPASQTFDDYDQNIFRQLMIMMSEENMLGDSEYKWATTMSNEVFTESNGMNFLQIGKQQGIFSRSIQT